MTRVSNLNNKAWAALVLAAVAAVIVVALVVGTKSAKAAFPGENGKIVFASLPCKFCGLSSYELYTIDADGTSLTRLTYTNTKDEHGPAWSPDGTKLAYTKSYAPPGTYSHPLYVANADGTAEKALFWGGCANPDWQPLP